jgi:TRAP-type C4-dicarboxylate transport system substrate-binding protein
MTVRRLLSLAIFVLAGATTAHAQAKELVMGNVNPPKHGTALASQQFIDKLAELTGGKTKIVHHHSGALGG